MPDLTPITTIIDAQAEDSSAAWTVYPIQRAKRCGDMVQTLDPARWALLLRQAGVEDSEGLREAVVAHYREAEQRAWEALGSAPSRARYTAPALHKSGCPICGAPRCRKAGHAEEAGRLGAGERFGA